MLFYKFIFLVIFFLILPKHVELYVYPIWGNAYNKQEKLVDSSEGDVTVTEFIITNFLIPMRDSFCNICVNFQEVYECVLANTEYFGDKNPPKTRSFVKRTLEFIGLYNREEYTTPPSCSYYSILVVTTSTIVFISLIYIAKKLVDYVKEEDKIFPQVLHDYQNKCPCFEKE